MSKASSKKHIAVLAFPFASHPRSMFKLICKLAISSPSSMFSYFSTETCINSILSPENSPKVPSNIKAYHVSDGFPPGHVLTRSPLEEVELFLTPAPENCRKSLNMAETETGIKFTSLLTDSFMHFAVDIAEELRIPWIAVFTAVPPALCSHFYTDIIRDLYENSPGDQILENIPGLSAFRVGDLPDPVLKQDLRDSIFSIVLSKINVISKAKAVAIGSFEELSSEELKINLNSKLKNFLHIGFLTVPQIPPPLNQSSDSDDSGCLSWLDKQAPASVAYVGFGTVIAPTKQELVALSEALEESGVPFLWSLNDDDKAKLPTGFLERTSNSKNGKIVAWTPQMQVLQHSSIAVHISHCGWNSVSESIVCGVPIIYRPLIGDNRIIGRMVEEEWGIGMLVEGGEITKDGMMRSLEIALGGERGKKMRAKAEELKGVVLEAAGPNGSGTKNFNTLLKLIS